MKTYPNKPVITGLLLALIAILVTGCNTMRGVGEDLESLGDSIQEEVND